MADAAKILVVDDDRDNLKITRKLLESQSYRVSVAESGQDGLSALESFSPDLVLLDVNMPGMDGLETIELLKERPNSTAVVFVTGNSSTSDVVKGLDAGALDYIVKPYSGDELLARVRAQLRVKKLQDELKTANEKLQDLVEIDDLTGLYNMRTIYQKLDQEIGRARRYGHGVAVVMLDMDHFKGVNDNHDHLFGSHVLAEVGNMIKDNIRTHDFAARYGGDEFLICLARTTTEGSRTFCERLRQVLENHTFQYEGSEIKLTASMGCALIVDGRSLVDARTLVRTADHNLYKSKDGGRNRATFTELYDKDLSLDQQGMSQRRG